jgi:hypothetical protein
LAEGRKREDPDQRKDQLTKWGWPATPDLGWLTPRRLRNAAPRPACRPSSCHFGRPSRGPLLMARFSGQFKARQPAVTPDPTSGRRGPRRALAGAEAAGPAHRR